MEDQAIIDLYWQRNPQAIEESSQKYGKLCRSVAFGVLRNQEDSEECVNDTWLRAWDSIPPQRPTKLSAFLSRITRNLALDRYDYNHAAKRTGSVDVLLSELSDCIPDQKDDYEALALNELLNRFLRALPEKQRNLFLRRYWYCQSIEELCHKYRMSQSAVKSDLFRTRNRLKEFLEKEGVGIE